MVAIHQPNYAPWLGYFAKMARADVFVFLDDVQYSKNSYINRVQIDAGGKTRWLTVPVSYHFSDPINHVRPADREWRRAHLEILKTYYSKAPAFLEVFRWLETVYEKILEEDIASSNQKIIECTAAQLGLACKFRRSSEFDTGDATSDDRLISILRMFGPNVVYLSGKGGANYQDSRKFQADAIKLEYIDFIHAEYDQGHPEFFAGLSVIDALFHLGFADTALRVMPTAT